MALRILHVEAHKEILEVGLLAFINSDVHGDQSRFFTLQDIQIEVILVPEVT